MSGCETGGLISATLLTLVVLPALYARFGTTEAAARDAASERHTYPRLRQAAE
ncbi:hypothetical protein [Methylobacterium sp. ID0610]|uniref:hypothetical protein n=1 Tax=Methylobacterium carpenticola TaxID=3344827 RepID=UPI0036A7DF95